MLRRIKLPIDLGLLGTKTTGISIELLIDLGLFGTKTTGISIKLPTDLGLLRTKITDWPVCHWWKSPRLMGI
jgi:hypothetical protein